MSISLPVRKSKTLGEKVSQYKKQIGIDDDDRKGPGGMLSQPDGGSLAAYNRYAFAAANQPYRPGWAALAGVGANIANGLLARSAWQRYQQAKQVQEAKLEEFKRQRLAAVGLLGAGEGGTTNWQEVLKTAPPGSGIYKLALQNIAAQAEERRRRNDPLYNLKLEQGRANIDYRRKQTGMLDPDLARQKSQAEIDAMKARTGLLRNQAAAVDPETAIQQRKAQIAQTEAQTNLIRKKADRLAAPPPPPPRRIVRGADGYQYYADTGERVLPHVKAPEQAKSSEYQKAYDRAKGKAVAEAEVALPGIKANVNRVVKNIDELLDNDLYTSISGFLDQGTWDISEQAIRARALHSQIVSQAALAGIDQLRGTGAISDAEGQRAANAITMVEQSIGNHEAYRKALVNLKQTMLDILRVFQQKAGLPQAPAPAQAQPLNLGNGIKIKRMK